MGRPRKKGKHSSVRIGAQYELAYRDWLEQLGMHVSARQAGSKGMFDLIAWSAEECRHVQLKAGRLSCDGANKLVQRLRAEAGLPSSCHAVVVHRTRWRSFCAHQVIF